jgi:hypothetical protein
MEKFLWKMKFEYGRQGTVEGLFVAADEEVTSLIGRTVSFGEILGKHSDVEVGLEDCDFTKIDVDAETVAKVSKQLGETWSGYNPLEYLGDNE